MGDRIQSVYQPWLRAQLSSVTSIGLWLAAIAALQEMLVEDFEFYAIYESSYSDLALSFLTFKPIEYLCEVVALFAILQGRSLLQLGVARVRGQLSAAL